MAMPPEQQGFDFIVVGSGAGGGVLASRLARNDRGLKVLLIDAGSDPRQNMLYQVPAFHALASEDFDLRWDYFVEHFSNSVLAQRDDKYAPGKGIFYPRASAIGGCTAHHAMITVYPDSSDWDDIAALTGDNSWVSNNMWSYFDRCSKVDRFRWLDIAAAGFDTALRLAQDLTVDQILLSALWHAPHLFRGNIVDIIGTPAEPVFDPNHRNTIEGNREGLYRIPLSTKGGEREGVTEFIYATKAHPVYGSNLTIWEDTLVAKVKFSGGRAEGVEYLQRKNAYRADRDGAKGDRTQLPADLPTAQVNASGEIILACGAFNTPQLLMNSGIGPAQHLKEMGVTLIEDRPGVGLNLQDRYEVPVIDEFDHEFALLNGYSFKVGVNDDGFLDWRNNRTGFYTTNGGTLAIIRRSGKTPGPNCDLFIFGIPGEFAGYRLGYSTAIQTPPGRSRFSWIILKAHTANSGEIRLRSTDPRDPPIINFKSFADGQRANDPDLNALEWAVDYVRQFMSPVRNLGTSKGEYLPGAGKTGQELSDFIMTHAWGHHASCTCRIGREDDINAVLDSEFRVIGAPGRNLRVVDASVFPKIPGYFIVLPIYMVAEKASDVILNRRGAATMPV
jgi:choline dehydrogenase